MNYETLLDKIDDLKNLCREYEQDLIDDKIVDIKEYREALRELFWLKLTRDSMEENGDDI